MDTVQTDRIPLEPPALGVLHPGLLGHVFRRGPVDVLHVQPTLGMGWVTGLGPVTPENVEPHGAEFSWDEGK